MTLLALLASDVLAFPNLALNVVVFFASSGARAVWSKARHGGR